MQHWMHKCKETSAAVITPRWQLPWIKHLMKRTPLAHQVKVLTAKSKDKMKFIKIDPGDEDALDDFMVSVPMLEFRKRWLLKNLPKCQKLTAKQTLRVTAPLWARSDNLELPRNCSANDRILKCKKKQRIFLHWCILFNRKGWQINKRKLTCSMFCHWHGICSCDPHEEKKHGPLSFWTVCKRDFSSTCHHPWLCQGTNIKWFLFLLIRAMLESHCNSGWHESQFSELSHISQPFPFQKETNVKSANNRNRFPPLVNGAHKLSKLANEFTNWQSLLQRNSNHTPWAKKAELHIHLVKETVRKAIKEAGMPLSLCDYCFECCVRIHNLIVKEPLRQHN